MLKIQQQHQMKKALEKQSSKDEKPPPPPLISSTTDGKTSAKGKLHIFSVQDVASGRCGLIMNFNMLYCDNDDACILNIEYLWFSSNQKYVIVSI